MIAKIGADLSDPTILTLAQDISSVDVNVVCDATQENLLRGIETLLQTSAGAIATALDEVLKDIESRKKDSNLTLISSLCRADRFNSSTTYSNTSNIPSMCWCWKRVYHQWLLFN